MKNHGIREVLIYQSIFLRWVGYEPEIRDENSRHAVMVPLSVAMRTTTSWSVPKFFQAAYDNDHPYSKVFGWARQLCKKTRDRRKSEIRISDSDINSNGYTVITPATTSILF